MVRNSEQQFNNNNNNDNIKYMEKKKLYYRFKQFFFRYLYNYNFLLSTHIALVIFIILNGIGYMVQLMNTKRSEIILKYIQNDDNYLSIALMDKNITVSVNINYIPN